MSGSDPDIKNVWQKLEQILRRGRGPVLAVDESASLWRQYSHDLCKDPLAMVGLAILVLLISIAVLAPYIAPYDPDAIEISRRLQWPNQDHLLGTDKFGRDVLSRIIFGARLSLLMPAIIVVISLTIGTTVGLLSGFKGGLVDSLLMRVVDIKSSFPGLLLTLAIIGMLGPGLFNAVIAMSISGWTGYARIIRGMTLSFREMEFIEAAKCLGASDRYILIKHILPNVVSPVVLLATLNMAGAILSLAGLGFLGLGAQPPTAEWGSMLSDSQGLIFSAPYLIFIPGIAIMITVLAFNLLGDGLRDAMDPKSGGMADEMRG
ncbi:MAG: ABC transporter permease [Methanothrix sp.]|jgi:peptide/nickel transport system permease protein|uniref:nickel transporter permease n=1 Tax=Methanothrix sp. TaxID=90426 RepID=UPI0025DCAD21|nr:nickel transporter permease [Methanothrix sp.]MCK9405158.1 ABC transporter permease [Methanothrix sp.]